MDMMQLIGMIITLLVFVAIGLWSGKLVKTKEDFYVAGSQFGAFSVAGAASGTYIGGGTVIGTAQLAFSDGFSALNFTIGCCASMLLTALVFSGRIRDSRCQTIQEMVMTEFGKTAGRLTILLGVLAMYINNISHLFSGVSLISSVFPAFPTMTSVVITAVLIFACACLGGFWGMSIINVIKTTILLGTAVVAAIFIFTTTGHFSELIPQLPQRFLTPFPRGAGTDMGNILSVMLGIVSSQTTMQAIYCGKTNADCKKGFLMGAVLLPVAGICCGTIGAYMRTIAPEINALQAFPMFVIMHTHGLVSGIILATTLVAVASAGTSIMLSVSGIMVNDVYMKLKPNATTRQQLNFSRFIMICCLSLSTFIISKGAGDGVMQYNFLSMGLRCTVLFFPMCAFLFFPGKVSRRCANISIISGPIALLLGKFVLPLPFDCIFLGVAVCLTIMVIGYFDQRYILKKTGVSANE